MSRLLRLAGGSAVALVVTVWPLPAGAQSRPAPGSAPAADPHAGHPSAQDAPPPAPPAAQDHAGDEPPARARLPSFIPAVTEEDRRAAFPDVSGHTVHDDALNYFVLFDQFEWQTEDTASQMSWDNKGWIGKNVNRFWFRTEGEAGVGRVTAAQLHALYGRAIFPWWDVVVGIRQDLRPGSPETWAAVGLQGLAPYWFEVEATAYVGPGARTHVRFEVEYDLLLTNRLKLQPLAEVEVYGKSDPERGIGAGLSTSELGLRVRYEFRRELAPYLGIVWAHKHGRTADFARAAEDPRGGTRLAVGLRMWF